MTGHELVTLARPDTELPPRMRLRDLAQQEPVGQHVLLDLSNKGELAGGLVPGHLTDVEQNEKTGAMGRAITVHQLVFATPGGDTLRIPAQTPGHATVTDQPVALAELWLAPVPGATPTSLGRTTVRAGTTVTGDVSHRATAPSSGPTPEPAPRSPQLDAALAYQLLISTVAANTTRGLA
ncbi:hypothetical protein ACWG8W_07515 [Citricoccus zhacaiensis]